LRFGRDHKQSKRNQQQRDQLHAQIRK
jgi:hypothetical protein